MATLLKNVLGPTQRLRPTHEVSSAPPSPPGIGPMCALGIGLTLKLSDGAERRSLQRIRPFGINMRRKRSHRSGVAFSMMEVFDCRSRDRDNHTETPVIMIKRIVVHPTVFTSMPTEGETTKSKTAADMGSRIIEQNDRARAASVE